MIPWLIPARWGRAESCPVRNSSGRSVKIGSQLGFAEADVTDPSGRLLAKAHSTLSVTKEQQA